MSGTGPQSRRMLDNTRLSGSERRAVSLTALNPNISVSLAYFPARQPRLTTHRGTEARRNLEAISGMAGIGVNTTRYVASWRKGGGTSQTVHQRRICLSDDCQIGCVVMSPVKVIRSAAL